MQEKTFGCASRPVGFVRENDNNNKSAWQEMMLEWASPRINKTSYGKQNPKIVGDSHQNNIVNNYII